MLNQEIKKVINDCVLCWLATSSAKGIPNVSPKEIFSTFGNDRILIANIASPQTVKNIGENNNVCLSMIDIFKQKGYQIKGTAGLVNRTDVDFQELSIPLIDLAGEEFPIACVIEVIVSSVKPIIAPRYFLFPDTTEEEQEASALKTYEVRR